MEAPKQSAVPDASQGLKNGLKSRHLTRDLDCGVIGGSLFIGSGNVIYSAGPAAVLACVWWITHSVNHAYAG